MLEGELVFQVEEAVVSKGTGELVFTRATWPMRWPITATHPRATC